MQQTTEQAASNGAKPGTMTGVIPVAAGDIVSYNVNGGSTNAHQLNYVPERWV